MVKAQFSLRDGTSVTIEGTTSQVRELLDYYGGNIREVDDKVRSKSKPSKRTSRSNQGNDRDANLAAIVNRIKDCDEHDEIEKEILDRTSQVDRVLLPLYIVHQYFDNSTWLTTGDIHKVTRSLGIPISIANISHTFAGSANRYVVVKGMSKRGQPQEYQLSRKGLIYLKSVLQGGKG